MAEDDDKISAGAEKSGDKPVGKPREEGLGEPSFPEVLEGVLASAEAAKAASQPEDLIPKNVLDITINGKTLRDLIAPLENFWRESGVSHAVAENELAMFFPALRDGHGFDYDSALSDLGVGTSVDFMPSVQRLRGSEGLSSKQLGDRELTSNLSDAVLASWIREGRVFLALPPRSTPHDFTPIALAMKCARITDSKRAFDQVMPKNPEDRPLEALRYQIMFSELSRMNLRKGEDANRHREIHVLAQIAAKLGEYGERVGGTRAKNSGFAPSVALAPELESQEECRKFINARISLLLPDNVKPLISDKDELQDLVQEDFITCDIVAFTKAVGLYDEYKPIFEALFHYRQLQFFQKVHLDPDIPEKDRPVRISLVKLLERVKEETGALPSLASFGCGNGLLEKILLSRGLVSSVSGVDKHEGDTNTHEIIDDNFRTTSVAVDRDEDSDRVKVKALEQITPSKVVIAPDSLHETDDPRGYLLGLFNRVVEPGGYLYITDPTYCLAVDTVTHDVLVSYDSTEHPGSMLSLEAYLEIVSYLKTQGAVVEYVTVVPGAYAGYIDTFPRLPLVIRKPEAGKALPYAVPGSSKRGLDDGAEAEARSVFEVFPFDLIPLDKRDLFLAEMNESSEHLSFSEGDMRRYFIAKLLRDLLGQTDGSSIFAQALNAVQSLVGAGRRDSQAVDAAEYLGVDKFLKDSKCFPYKNVSRLLEVSGANNAELVARNQSAAEVTAIAKLLKEKLNMDVYPELARQPGWEFFSG